MIRPHVGASRVVSASLALSALFLAGYLGTVYLQKSRSLPVTISSREGASRVSVHVAGAVRRPGLYELSPPVRVQDAIETAGGATEEASLDHVNLAETVSDGMKIYVPRRGELPPPAAASAPSGSRARAPKPPPLALGSISLNEASAEELDLLPGVGPAIARRIIDYRNAHGGFRSIDELEKVKGIGPKTMARLRPYLRL